MCPEKDNIEEKKVETAEVEVVDAVEEKKEEVKTEDNVVEATEVKEEVIEPELMVSIKNTSGFTKEGYTAMNKYMSRKAMILVILCEIVLAGIDVFLYIQQSWMFAIVISVLICVYPFLLKFMSKRQLDKTFVTYEQAFKDSTYEYDFQNDKVQLLFTSNGQQSQGSIDYKSIYSVTVDTDYIFIFISSNQAYIVEKKGFEKPEDIETLINLFRASGVKVTNK